MDNNMIPYHTKLNIQIRLINTIYLNENNKCINQIGS